MNNAEFLRSLAKDPDKLFAVHLKIEDLLIEMRDGGLQLGIHANGLAVKDQDGQMNGIIRIGTREAIKIVLESMADLVEEEEGQ